MSERQRLVSRAGAVYALLVSLLVCSLVAFPWSLPSDWHVVEVASAQTAATMGNNGSPTSTGGIRLIGSDNTTDHWVGVDANGNVYTWDRSNNTPHLELNIRANNGLSTKFVSAPIDMSLMGPRPWISVRASGNATYFVGVEGAPTSVMDSTSAVPCILGKSDPLSLAKGAYGAMRIVTAVGCVSTDSSFVSRAAGMFPIADSLTGVAFDAPYTRIILISNTAPTSNVYLHIFGGLR